MDEYTYKDFFHQVFSESRKIFLTMGVAPYIIPYLPRRINELFGDEGPENTEGIFFGVVSSVGALELQAYGYYEAVKNGYPQVLLAPVATNLGILLYEKVIKKLKKSHESVTM